MSGTEDVEAAILKSLLGIRTETYSEFREFLSLPPAADDIIAQFENSGFSVPGLVETISDDVPPCELVLPAVAEVEQVERIEVDEFGMEIVTLGAVATTVLPFDVDSVRLPKV